MMIGMEPKIEKNPPKQKLGTLDRTIDRLRSRRLQSIRKSMIRPLYQEVLKSLFFVLVLLVDTLIPLEVYRDIIIPFNIVLSLVILCVFLYGEVRFYNSFWGKKGRWSLDKYKTKPETVNRKKE